jgi:hypothetical protein
MPFSGIRAARILRTLADLATICLLFLALWEHWRTHVMVYAPPAL